MVKTLSGMDKKICGAKTRNDGKCQRRPTLNGRCHLHGGRSLAGKDSPTFKHGRYSKYLPTKLQERANELLKSRQLFEARDDMALLQMRLCGLLEGKTVGPDQWDIASASVLALKNALSEGDTAATQAAMAEVDEFFKRGLEDAAAWQEIYRIQNLINKTRDSSTRRDAVKTQSISLIEAQVLMSRIVDAVRQHVTDRDILVKIAQEFTRVTNADAGSWENPYLV